MKDVYLFMYPDRSPDIAEVLMSQMTKRALEASLKKLLLQKPLTKKLYQ